MKYSTIAMILLAFCKITFGQEYLNSKTYESFKSADSLLQNVLSFNYQNIEAINYRLTGNLYYQGHYSTPKERRTLPNTITITAYRDSAYLQTDSTHYGKSVYTESAYLSKDSALIMNDEGKVLSQGYDANKNGYAPLYSPITLIWELLDHKSSVRYLGFDKASNCEVVSYLSFNKQVSLFINQSSLLIDRAEILDYSKIHGDYLLQYFFSDYKVTNNNLNCPHKLIVKEWGEVLQELTYTYNKIEKSANDKAPLHFSHKKIADQLYRISYPTQKHYSYVIDYGDYLGIIEAPMSNNDVIQLESYVNSNLLAKPIKYIFLTHHHPDHAGGFAYFYKKGATIVTTDLSSKYQKELLECPHCLNEENNIPTTKEGVFEVIDNKAIKNYATHKIAMSAIAFADNGHTKEFILYYFPESNILIVGDYFYVSSKIRGSKRADLLNQFIKSQNIKVDKIYPTWSPVGTKEYCAIKELKESARLFKEKQQQK